MVIRKAHENDLESIMRVYDVARKYMAENGNKTQWGNNRPLKSTIEKDIKNQNCYIGIGDDNEIHSVFAFVAGNDPTYAVIEKGRWLNDEPYSVIHRVASDGKIKGFFKECLEFCVKRCKNIRIDTHENNLTMQYLLDKYGFVKCGIIHIANGDPRIAYELSID